MRIIHTVQLYEPHKGGSEEVVRQLSERLVARGHEVTVATGADPMRTWSSLNGVEVRSFEISGNLATGMTGDTKAYQSFLESSPADVVLNYAAQIWSTDLALGILDRIEACKVLVPCGYNLADPRLFDYYAALPRFLTGYDALVYMSDSYQDYRFGEEHGLGDKAVIIPNGASEEEFDAATPSFREAYRIRTELMVLTVANHYYGKGHRKAIEAFKRLGDVDATLVIIGEGSLDPRGSCLPRCLLTSAFNGRIKVVRGVPRDLIVSAYKEADVFLLASEIECAPLVIYEAMAAGTPFVSTDCGNVRDNSAYGTVVSDVGELPGAMRRLLDDRDLRSRLGAAAQSKWRQEHTWDKITDQYEALYSGLVRS